MLRVKTLSARDRHWQIREQQNNRQLSNIKACASVPVHWQAECLSPTQNCIGEAGSFKLSEPEEITRMSPDSLQLTFTTKPWVCIDLPYAASHISQPSTDLLRVDCHCWIAQVDLEFQSQTRYYRILDCKPFIDTYDRMGQILARELKFFLFIRKTGVRSSCDNRDGSGTASQDPGHTTQAAISCKHIRHWTGSKGGVRTGDRLHPVLWLHPYKFCSMLIEQLINLRNVRIENLKFRTNLRSSGSSYGWLVNITVDDYVQRQIAKKIFENRKSKLNVIAHPVTAGLQGFQTLHFICYQFGCKLWLQSIQNHARDHSQAFAHRYLK